MTSQKMLPIAATLYISTALLSAPSNAADDKFDIVGLRLGMNYEEVIEAMTAHGIEAAKIQENRASYNYSDGLKHGYRTEDFLTGLHGSKGSLAGNQQKSDSLAVAFSPPPEGGRVVVITRTVHNEIDPSTNAQYRAAVHAKYGPPDEHRNGIGKWFFGQGTMNCLPAGLPGRNQNILQKAFRTHAGQFYPDQFANPRVKRLEECANMLTYSVGLDLGDDDRPATRVTATMVDLQSWVRAELAANAWVDSLSREATRKRQGSGAEPSL